MSEELAKIETVLPSWRFIMSDEMGAEADRFFRQVDYFPRTMPVSEARKFAKTFANDLPRHFPLIAKIDQKLGGCITAAVLHLGEGDHNTHQPGYIYLIGRMFNDARRVGKADGIRSACENFINYSGAPLNEGSGISSAERRAQTEAEVYNAKQRAIAAKRQRNEQYLSR